jgi:hypothetical protein
MHARTKRRTSSRKNKTRKGGVFKTALAATALATGAMANKIPLGKGVTPVGVGAYGINRPAPSRNVAGLSVMRENTTPSYLKNRVAHSSNNYSKGKLTPKNAAMMPGWPQPKSNNFVPSSTWKNWTLASEPVGTRYTAPPEIQTWNPYLRGDPEEVVDFYEGFSNADKKKLMETDGDGGMVKRKNTPMWQAAMRHSAKLPDFKSASNYGSTNANHGKQQEQISNLMWQQWATEGRKMGMNIPLNDPRRQSSPPAEWANVPSLVPSWYAKQQFHHGLGPLPSQNIFGTPTMKGNKPLPVNWKNSNLAKNKT